MGTMGDRYECSGPTDHATEVRIRWCAGCSRWHFKLLSVRSSASSSNSWQISDEVVGYVEHDDLADHRWAKIIRRAVEQAYQDGSLTWKDGDPRLW